MRVYSCASCKRDPGGDGYGICLLTVRDTEHPPTGCPFPTGGDEYPDWELRVVE